MGHDLQPTRWVADRGGRGIAVEASCPCGSSAASGTLSRGVAEAPTGRAAVEVEDRVAGSAHEDNLQIVRRFHRPENA
jgi:hypothetical protein